MKALALLSGLLFGFGLILSGMTDPARVLAFLDVTGAWNPSLAFVMGGAVLTAIPTFAYARRHTLALSGASFPKIDRLRIDRRLIIGAVIFGLGWGLSGLCPGPALVLAASGNIGGLVFVAAIAGGFLIAKKLTRLIS